MKSVEPERTQILLVDDDPRYCDELTAYLKLYGFNLRCLVNPRQLQSACAAFEPDLILLDQRLGTTTGTEVLRDLRKWSDVPCIVVTGMPDATDRVLNLEVGADDEVDKSLSPRELLARIRAVLRRHRLAANLVRNDAESADLLNGWTISLQLRELHRPDGTVCDLTSAEFETLSMLYRAGGKAVSRAAICEKVFGRGLQHGDRSVDTIIAKLRRKIALDDRAAFIKSVRPFGYVLTAFPGKKTHDGH